MDNIYKDLEIKDYEKIDEFIVDVRVKHKFLNGDDFIVIFGGADFIWEVVLMLSDHGYNVSSITLDRSMASPGDKEYIYSITIDSDKQMCVESAYWDDGVKRSIRFYHLLNNGNVYGFINENYTEQQIVDYSLVNLQETVLFGIEGYEL